MRPAAVGPILYAYRASTVPTPNSPGAIARSSTVATVTATGASGPERKTT